MAADTLTETFRALVDPTRRAILERLASGPATVKELSAPFEISGPAISKHLRVLEEAGLIRRGREAQRRPCELTADPLREVAEWTRGVPAVLGRELGSARRLPPRAPGRSPG
jgi:DNA-binding transcriptional ArsR family regulator